jgi:O-methyltransferase involved in polyketide biosynthesis
LAKDVRTTVVTIGAGFDTRPYRLTGGRWIEIDEPAIIEYKNERLPLAECPKPVSRIPIVFSTESLASRLDTIANHGPVVVVVEGVFMYLEPVAIEATLAAICGRFRRHTLLCDLMNRRFFERFAQSVHAKLMAAGGTFTARPDDPVALLRKHDYVETERIPIFGRAAELGVLWDRVGIPAPVAWLMLNVFARDLRGYAVHRFARG